MNSNDVNNALSELLVDVGLSLPSNPLVLQETAKTGVEGWLSDDYDCQSVFLINQTTMKAVVTYNMSSPSSEGDATQTGKSLRVRTALTFRLRQDSWVLSDSEIIDIIHPVNYP